MIKTIIIDDERPAINNLERFLQAYDQIEVVASYKDVTKAIKEVHNYNVNLVFLDVDMPKMNGIEAAEKILQIDSNIDIVFVTAYNDYAVDAFEVEAVDYVMKPIMKKRLDKTMDRVIRRFKANIHDKKENELRVLCFGNFEIFWGNESLKWRTSKAEEFIAYLVHQRGNFVQKAKIIEELWPDKDEKQATKLLHTSVYYVRNTFKNIGLEGAINYSNKMYKFDIPDFYCDVDEFNKIMNSLYKNINIDIKIYKEILEIYRGEYFEGNDYSWSINEQAQYRKKYVDVLVDLSDSYIRQGKYNDAIMYLKVIAKFDPFDEENHRKLLTAYINNGDLVSFKKHYSYIREAFRNELGEDLSLKTKELCQIILS